MHKIAVAGLASAVGETSPLQVGDKVAYLWVASANFIAHDDRQ
jgi:hypothetical protein